VAIGSNCDYDPKPQHRLCDFNAGLPKKSHVWEEANTKNQTKPYLRPSSAPCRAGSLESNKKLQRALRPVNAMAKVAAVSLLAAA
jgi:hypothetical protein